jgi:hypothetical protein
MVGKIILEMPVTQTVDRVKDLAKFLDLAEENLEVVALANSAR